MKQKIVIKVSTNGGKCRSKAMRIAVAASGVESVSWKGDDKTQMEVTGDGLDAAVLTLLLRKKMGQADLVSVEKKEDDKAKESEVKPLVAWPYDYYNSVPYTCYAAPYPEFQFA